MMFPSLLAAMLRGQASAKTSSLHVLAALGLHVRATCPCCGDEVVSCSCASVTKDVFFLVVVEWHDDYVHRDLKCVCVPFYLILLNELVLSIHQASDLKKMRVQSYHYEISYLHYFQIPWMSSPCSNLLKIKGP